MVHTMATEDIDIKEEERGGGGSGGGACVCPKSVPTLPYWYIYSCDICVNKFEVGQSHVSYCCM